MSREFEFKKKFAKKFSKLKGQEQKNVAKKIREIIDCKDLTHYKNLRYDLKSFRRVHVNTFYLMSDDYNNT